MYPDPRSRSTQIKIIHGVPNNMELGKRRTDDAERLLTEKKNKKYNKYMKNNVRLNIVFWIKSFNIFASFIYRKSKEKIFRLISGSLFL